MKVRGNSKRRCPRLILIGEGKAEVGPKLPQEKRKHEEGVFSTLLARAVGGKSYDRTARFPFEVIDAQTWQDVKIHGPRRKRLKYSEIGKVFDLKARLALFKVKSLAADGIAFLLDRERTTAPDPRSHLLTAVRKYREATASTFFAVVGSPQRCLETWLLADPQARRTAFGADKPNPFTGDPEKRPNARALKGYITRRGKTGGLSEAEARKALAANARPEELAKRCPKSYGPFWSDVKTQLKPLC